VLAACLVGWWPCVAQAAKTASWSKVINTPKRFTVLKSLGNAAVLDNETGLVWERSPSTDTFDSRGAKLRCNGLVVGNRLGWRLPTVQELSSLLDPTAGSGVKLPAGHPFTNVQTSYYWTATTHIASPTTEAWFILVANPEVGIFNSTGQSFVWCVRGGSGVDVQ
jgi:hypothetical protein